MDGLNSRLETLDENINELEVRHQKLSKLSTKSKKSEKKINRAPVTYGKISKILICVTEDSSEEKRDIGAEKKSLNTQWPFSEAD